MKGCNFSQYIREFRLDYALRLMETGNYSIKEVADNSGFRSTSFFSTSFKKYMNISPKKYQLRLNNR
jgi:AraC-like DNA-binding protein